MKIKVAINDVDPQKKKGDLLEKIAKELLITHNYEVETQLRNTGVELDLLCQNKANASKKIYVECKAYGEDNKIQSDVITSLHGIRGIKNYEEAWLISTSELGKDAKGLVKEIEAGKAKNLEEARENAIKSIKEFAKKEIKATPSFEREIKKFYKRINISSENDISSIIDEANKVIAEQKNKRQRLH